MTRKSTRLPVPGTFEPDFVEERAFQAPTPEWLRHGHPYPHSVRVYDMGECSIIVAVEPSVRSGLPLLHLSISHPSRHPTWDEIKVARYRLLPDEKTFVMFLPPRDEYVNVPAQDHVFHLWEEERT